MEFSQPLEFTGNDRYAVRRRVGGGGMGTVYEAYDRKRQAVVALKTLRSSSAQHIYRLKQEFRSLADLSHPNLVALYELVGADERWFIVMEMVEGQSFVGWVRGESGKHDSVSHGLTFFSGEIESQQFVTQQRATGPSLPPDVDKLRGGVIQLLQGLAALHAADKLHRDVKPSNVVVTDEGRVVILDFGLVYETDRAASEQSRIDKVVGTAAFMPPELATGAAPTAASDMYSAGVMLYQALTGLLPFEGTIAQMLRDKATIDVAAPSIVLDGVPEDLDGLCVALLARDARDRPSAAEALRMLGEVPQTTPQRPDAGAESLDGREAQRQFLEDAWATARKGRVVVVSVKADSGMGKTSLVRHFVKQVRRREEITFLQGRCYERESVPFKAFDALMDAVRRRMRNMPAEVLDNVLPQDMDLLARLFPVLEEFVLEDRSTEVADPSTTFPPQEDPTERRTRAFQACWELIRNLARQRPVIVFLDDVQWGDVDSALLLVSWLRRAFTRTPLMVVLAYRAENEEDSEFLTTFRHHPVLPRIDHRALELSVLTPEQSSAVAMRLLGDNAAEENAAWIARESGGNPYLLVELVRQVQAAIERGDEALAEGKSLDDVFKARIAGLPQDARDLLLAAALAGRPLPIHVLAKAARLDDPVPALTVLRAHHFVRTIQGPLGELVELYHDRIGQTLQEGTLTVERAGAHLRLASAMESSGWKDPEALMTHNLNAGKLERAAELGLEAARVAADNLAFDKSARLYRTALSLKDWDEDRLEDIHIALADSLTHAGRGKEAADAYLHAAGLASSGVAAGLRQKATEQLITTGYLDEGRKHLPAVLGDAGLQMPTNPMWMALWLFFVRPWIKFWGYEFKTSKEASVDPALLQKIDVCWFLAQAFLQTDPLLGAVFHTRNLQLSLRAGEPYRISRAMAMELAMLAMTGSDGDKTFGKLQLRVRELAASGTGKYTAQATGIVQAGEGMAAYLEARFKTGYRVLRQAERTFQERCPGQVWELDTSRLYALRALMYIGELKQAADHHRELLQYAEDRGNLLLTANLRSDIFVLLKLATGDNEGVRRDLRAVRSRLADTGFHYQHFFYWRGRALVLLFEGERGADALREWVETEQRAKDSYMLRNRFSRINTLDLRGRCAVAANDVKAAQRAAKALRSEVPKVAHAAAAAIEAGIAQLQGKDPTALLEEALKSFDRADMGLRAAMVRRRLGITVPGRDGRQHRAGADGWLLNQGITEAEKLERVLLPGFPPES